MKSRLPQGMGGQPNLNQMMRQAQKMQEEMAAAQEQLSAKEYSGSGGGGRVEATVTGEKRVKALRIDPAVIDPDDAEFLQDMIAAAVNGALEAADADAAEVMGKITGPMGM